MVDNSSSGLEIGIPGRMLAGRTATGKVRNRFSGRPKTGSNGGLQCFPWRSSGKVRPGRPISGPEPLLRNRRIDRRCEPRYKAALDEDLAPDFTRDLSMKCPLVKWADADRNHCPLLSTKPSQHRGQWRTGTSIQRPEIESQTVEFPLRGPA